jgi:hypothetical protein
MLIQESNIIDVLCISSNANKLEPMGKKRRELSEEEHAEAGRLKLAFEKAKKNKPELSQAVLADLVGWANQSAISQYLNGHIPLNIEALMRICPHIDADPYGISPRLMRIMDGSGASYTPPAPSKYVANPYVKKLIQHLERMDQAGILSKNAIFAIENMLVCLEESAVQADVLAHANSIIKTAGGTLPPHLKSSADILKIAAPSYVKPAIDMTTLLAEAAETNKKSPV